MQIYLELLIKALIPYQLLVIDSNNETEFIFSQN